MIELRVLKTTIHHLLDRGVGSFFKVGRKTRKYFTGSKQWVGKCPFSLKVKQKSGWARAHPASTPLLNDKTNHINKREMFLKFSSVDILFLNFRYQFLLNFIKNDGFERQLQYCVNVAYGAINMIRCLSVAYAHMYTHLEGQRLDYQNIYLDRFIFSR